MKRHVCTRVTNQHTKNRRGVSTVEFALVVPVFFTVLLGIVEVSWALCATNVATNVARESAHLAIMDDQTESTVTQFGKTLASNLMSVDGTKVNITVSVTDKNGTAKASYANVVKGDLVHVNVMVPYSDISLIPGKWLSSVPIRGTCSMMKI